MDQWDGHLGHVCVSFLNWWTPSITPEKMLTQLYSIFYLANPASPYGIERAEEYNNNRALYESKVKYFTKKYATKENFGKENEDKDWDFSYQNYINLIINANGQEKLKVLCDKNELTEDALERIKNKLGIDYGKEPLFIFKRKKLKLDVELSANGLEDNSEIFIIYNVVY